MKVLISGASGLLGNALSKQIRYNGDICMSLNRNDVPLSLNNSIITLIDSYFDGVDHFIHAAANTNVELCEAEPAICYRDNVLLTEILAAAARRKGVAMTYISSTGVYGSHQSDPWAEYDEPLPRTHHHRSKLLGEQCVLAANRSNLIIRTGWLFGGDIYAPKNFVSKRIQEARLLNEGVIFSNHQQHGCPTNVDDVAAQVMKLIMLGATGIFNVVNSGSASRFEYVSEIMRCAELPVVVRAVAASDFKRIAPVSNNEMAINWRSDSLSLTPMRCWRSALADYVMQIKDII